MPDTQIVTNSKNDGEVSWMGGYEGKVAGNERKRREGIKPQREETDTRGLYPSMPETWNVAESKCGKEVSGMGGYERHVSGHDEKQMNVKDHTSHGGKREVRRQGLRQCRRRKVLRGGTMKKRYPA